MYRLRRCLAQKSLRAFKPFSVSSNTRSSTLQRFQHPAPCPAAARLRNLRGCKLRLAPAEEHRGEFPTATRCLPRCQSGHLPPSVTMPAATRSASPCCLQRSAEGSPTGGKKAKTTKPASPQRNAEGKGFYLLKRQARAANTTACLKSCVRWISCLPEPTSRILRPCSP